jgi:hypothetical protein
MLSHYNVVFALASAYALIELALLFQGDYFGIERGSLFRSIVAICIPFGLWLQSKTARYLGAAWFALAACMVAWTFIANQKIVWSAPVIFVALFGVLSLLECVLLLFSREFADEFEKRRIHGPNFKQVLRRVFMLAVVAAAIIASLVDVYNLMIL